MPAGFLLLLRYEPVLVPFAVLTVEVAHWADVTAPVDTLAGDTIH